MKYLVKIKRQNDKTSPSYYQTFDYEGDNNISVAAMLTAINARNPLVDSDGNAAETIAWECGCMSKKCGACAMRINTRPALACEVFLDSIKGNEILLEPFTKFPVIKDLVIDRSSMFESLKKIEVWLNEEAQMKEKTAKARYQSAKCLMCGCCLEVCPGYSKESIFAGSMVAVNTFRIMDQETDVEHRKKLKANYREAFYKGCAKSLSCHNVCPAGLSVEELTSRTNAALMWWRK